MQTFVPYPDAARSAEALDISRCGKQRVETYQLLLWLHGVQMWNWEHRIVVPRMPRYSSHPALAMWSGHERALLRYQDAFCTEWAGRGYADTCLDKSTYVVGLINRDPASSEWPDWWGDEFIHMVHRSNLVWKDKLYYGERFPAEYPQPPYDPESGENYWAYRWPTGRIPVRERISEHHAFAVQRLGVPVDIIASKQEEFGWDTDHPVVTAFNERFLLGSAG